MKVGEFVFRCFLTVCTSLLCLLAVTGPASAAVQETGWLRLAHLSPDTRAVDFYLYSVGKAQAGLVLRHVSYGTVSPYVPVAAGFYTVALRLAGAGASTRPVLSTAVLVEPGAAYTVTGTGPGLRLAVLSDRLAAPSGQALVRVIQASMRQSLVTVRAGAVVLCRALRFGQVSAYQELPSGGYRLQAAGPAGAGSGQFTPQVGSVHTLVMLDVAGHLKIVDLVDAAGSPVVRAAVPVLSLGGTAEPAGPSIAGWLTLAVTGPLLLLAGLAKFRRSQPASQGEVTC
ncbi:MAG TPA: DUF4397 domain-containing protein [Streptosporangiaceae bacterium]|nr:DUF4397 domain-containing protein [Streptosporangiaceae bacterium]